MAEHRLDVDDRRAVDSLDRADQQPVLSHFAHRNLMKANWVRPVGRACCKDTSQSSEWIRTGMNLQHIAMGLVQPSQNDELVSGLESVKALRRERIHFQPGVGRALRSLFGRFSTRSESRSNHTNRAKLRGYRPGPHTFGALSRPPSVSLLDRHRVPRKLREVKEVEDVKEFEARVGNNRRSRRGFAAAASFDSFP